MQKIFSASSYFPTCSDTETPCVEYYQQLLQEKKVNSCGWSGELQVTKNSLFLICCHFFEIQMKASLLQHKTVSFPTLLV